MFLLQCKVFHCNGLVNIIFISDIGIYLKSDAAVRYAVTTSYDVIITCTDGITSDTNNLTVNIMPNSKPVFENWIGRTLLKIRHFNQDNFLFPR